MPLQHDRATENELFFPTSWDTTVRVSTVFAMGILIVLAGLLTAMGMMMFQKAQLASGLCFLGALAPWCIIMAFSQYGVSGYRILADAILIVRHIGSVSIPIESIQGVALLEPDALYGARRIYGSGWVFGNSGVLTSPRWERIQVYITRKDNLVLIERTGAIPILLSPDDPRAFIHALHGARDSASS